LRDRIEPFEILQRIEADVSRGIAMPLLQLVGGACIIEEGESLLDDWQVRGVAAHSTEVLAASALQRCRIAWGMS
jgi:hypothetical protein